MSSGLYPYTSTFTYIRAQRWQGEGKREREHQNKNADVKQLPVGKAGMHTASPRVENTLTTLEMGAEDTFTSLSFKKKEFHLQAHRSV